MLTMHFPPAFLNSNYYGSCIASGDPVSLVHATLDHVEHCHYTTSVVDTDQYTRKITINIQPVTIKCRGAMVKCQANSVQKILRLNVTGEIIATNTTISK